jgi:hypothetical protein
MSEGRRFADQFAASSEPALAAIFGASITPAAGNRAAQAPNRPEIRPPL